MESIPIMTMPWNSGLWKRQAVFNQTTSQRNKQEENLIKLQEDLCKEEIYSNPSESERINKEIKTLQDLISDLYVTWEELSIEERNELIQKQPAYGNIICRCEMISEGEILDAIHRPLGARSLDGVKRRTRAGMGRCQAGFCSPRTMEILERELKLSMFDITKNGVGSNIAIGLNKEI